MQTKETGPRNGTEKPQVAKVRVNKHPLGIQGGQAVSPPVSAVRFPPDTEPCLPPSLNPSSGNRSSPSACALSNTNSISWLPQEEQQSTELGCQLHTLALHQLVLAPPSPFSRNRIILSYSTPQPLASPLCLGGHSSSGLTALPLAVESEYTRDFINVG